MALVCLCHGVNERRVRREIEHGATSIDQVAERCGAGSCCLGCHPTIDALLAEHEQLTAVAVPARRRLRFAS
jgi:bacterioferritin-associated ferredoxin